MSILNIVSGSYCHSKDLVKNLIDRLGYTYIEDSQILAETEKQYSVSVKKLYRAMYHKPSIFNSFTHEKERNIAILKKVLAESLNGDKLVYHGFLGLLMPPTVSHVLKVCLIADIDYRIREAIKQDGVSEKDALKAIKKYDEEHNTWTQHLFELPPWDSSLYDIVIPVDKTPVEDTYALIEENLNSYVLQTTPESLQDMDDIVLAARVEVELAGKGHDVLVYCHKGEITLTINKHVLRLEHLENELKSIVSTLPDVKDVHTRVGPNYYKADIYRKIDFEKPSKVLLVDDEKDFVQTLSKRLQMRDMGSVFVHDGEEAIALLKEEEPDVMVLDLRMPGIDGMEVLKRVKQESPHTEVIILTGHGSKEDEQMAMKLGAFAYLNKPVDIAVLTRYMHEAQNKVNEAKKGLVLI